MEGIDLNCQEMLAKKKQLPNPILQVLLLYQVIIRDHLCSFLD